MAAVSHYQQSAAVPAAASILPASFYSAAALYVSQAVHERQAVAAAVAEIGLHPPGKAGQKFCI